LSVVEQCSFLMVRRNEVSAWLFSTEACARTSKTENPATPGSEPDDLKPQAKGFPTWLF
jgi:hypothetical protein